MASLNKVQLIGHLGKDPEIRTFPSGDQVANITVATTDKWKDKQTGEMKELTEWSKVVFNGRLAEIAGQYLRKGSQVYIEGSLRTRKWTDKDGAEKYTTEIRADSMQMLGARPQSGGNDGGQYQPRSNQAPQQQRSTAPVQRQQAPAASPAGGNGFDDMDDDIPFVSASMAYDMTTRKARKMACYDY